MSEKPVNSMNYWDDRFDTDWEQLSGREQSRFFGSLAIQLLPEWLLAASVREGLSWCDWGCALGDGTNELATGLPDGALTGVDFSAVAIERAQETFPGQRFEVADWVADAAAPEPDFDVVFSSNTLEHFHAPWKVLEKVASHARHCVVALIPYRERVRISEHHASFTPENIPTVLPDGKILVHARVRDTRNDTPCFWGGEQILLVWVTPEWNAAQHLHLGDLHVAIEPQASHLAPLVSSATALAAELGVSAEYLRSVEDGVAEHTAVELLGHLATWSAARQKMSEATGPAWTGDLAARDAREMVELRKALQALDPVLAGSHLLERLQLVERNTSLILEDVRTIYDQAAGDKASAIAERERAVAERETAMSEHLAAIAAREAALTEHLAAIDERNAARLEAEAATRQFAMTAGLCQDVIALYAQAGRMPDLTALTELPQDSDWQLRFQRELLRSQALRGELSVLYASSSWRVTRPLRFLRRFVSKPRSTFVDVRRRAAARIPEHKAGKVGAALRFARRLLKNGRIDPADRTRLKQMVVPVPGAAERADGVADYSKLPRLAPAREGCADVFIWSVIDWHFRTQRPQHLATALAQKGHRVFYISNNFADSPGAGFKVEDLGVEGRLFQVNLHLQGAPQIYHAMPDAGQAAAIADSLRALLGWTASTRCISFVQHPYWFEPAQCLPDMQLVYDCMDHHGGFEDNAEAILGGERELIQRSDLLVVTSQWLHDELSSQARNIAMVRNATEYQHFCELPQKVFVDPQGRRVIGYYGAIAEWFDVELLRKVALANPEALVLMVGRDTARVAEQVADIGNIQFTGEVPYAELPFWLYGFDVCLLPFRVIPLTLATNPVKVYEYLSAGKPVVSVDLPELSQFDGLVHVAADHEAFVGKVAQALAEPRDDQAAQQVRRDFAAQQTWLHRAEALDAALGNIDEPLISIIVLTYNNLAFTQRCLASLEACTDYANIEVIVVDNASTDGSPAYVAEWAAQDPRRTFIANPENVGFSAGNNVGLRVAKGDYLVVLNNDTEVTPGWLRGLRNHLRRERQAGLVGPVTNNIGNEAKIEISYDDSTQMIARAGAFTRRHAGKAFPIATAAFFCVMISREAFEKVGELDERFGLGFFEDDDYCRRLEQEGFIALCAEDVFVHHHLSASFGKLKNQTKQALFEKNRAIYEAKWGPWEPHQYRPRSG